MSDLFYFAGQVLVIVIGAVCFALIIVLFTRWSTKQPKTKAELSGRGLSSLFEDGRVYDVTLSSGQRLDGLTFEGVLWPDNNIGFAFLEFARFRKTNGAKVILRITHVRVFEEVTATTRPQTID